MEFSPAGIAISESVILLASLARASVAMRAYDGSDASAFSSWVAMCSSCHSGQRRAAHHRQLQYGAEWACDRTTVKFRLHIFPCLG